VLNTAYVKNNSLPQEWLFATSTDPQMWDLAKNGFKLSMGQEARPRRGSSTATGW
jgi:hypothetical protein